MEVLPDRVQVLKVSLEVGQEERREESQENGQVDVVMKILLLIAHKLKFLKYAKKRSMRNLKMLAGS